MDVINYSEELKQAIQIAQSIAKENSNQTFSPAHLLKALIHKDLSVRPMLKSLDKDIFFIEEWADVRIETYPKSSKIPDILKADNELISVLNEADNIRIKLSSDSIDTLSVFISICTPGVGFSYEQLKSFPVTPGEIFDASMKNASLTETVGKAPAESKQPGGKQTSLLKYTVDKLSMVREGKLEKT